MSIIHAVIRDQEHTPMRPTPLYAPDGMTSAGGHADRFDDGLVHNHHWAVTADEAYPSQGSAAGFGREMVFSSAGNSSFQSHFTSTSSYDRHDDGLVHNHHWAVSGK